MSVSTFCFIVLIVLYATFIAMDVADVVRRRRFEKLLERMIEQINYRKDATGHLRLPGINGPIAHRAGSNVKEYVFTEYKDDGAERDVYVSEDCSYVSAGPWVKWKMIIQEEPK